MSAFTASPGALRLFLVSIVARLPLAMLTIGVLVHVEGATGSFAVAGLASGALAVAQGIGGPLLGRLVDRRGQTAVLAVSALVAGAALAGVAALPADAPVAALLACCALLGAATPPVPACTRALLPLLVRDPDALRGAYAVDSAAVELTWISGPPIVLLMGAAWSTGAALTIAGALLVGSTLLFAAAPASREWRPDEATASGGPNLSALRSSGIRTLTIVLGGAGARCSGRRRSPSPPRPTASATRRPPVRCSGCGAWAVCSAGWPRHAPAAGRAPVRVSRCCSPASGPGIWRSRRRPDRLSRSVRRSCSPGR